jgi:hypothetical protein
MTVRFNDSLPVLVRTLRAAGIDVEALSTVVVRDATGRLLVALTEQRATAELMADLSAALGAYAAPTPTLDGSIAKPLAKDPSLRVMTLEIDDDVLDVRLIDRRVVGADWLLNPEPRSPSGPPRLVFGSLKGGVGRSTALTVFAAAPAAISAPILRIPPVPARVLEAFNIDGKDFPTVCPAPPENPGSP